MPIVRTTQVLDTGMPHENDRTTPQTKTLPILLDGKGNQLPKDAQPVFLTFSEKEVRAGQCANSRGELFNPQPVFPLAPFPGG